jgi:hypothetical protein
MSSPLLDVWEAAASHPFQPTVGKDTQFTLGFVLLAICTFRSGPYWCSHGAMLTMRSPRPDHHLRPEYAQHNPAGFRLTPSHTYSHRPIARQSANSRGSGFTRIRVRGLQHGDTLFPTNHAQLWRRLHDLRSRRIRLVFLFYPSGAGNGPFVCTVYGIPIKSSRRSNLPASYTSIPRITLPPP